MSVIVEVWLPADAFELGRILEMDPGTTITLETLVPLGERAVPFFRVHGHGHDPFEGSVGAHPAVEEIRLVNEHDDEALYALDWTISADSVMGGVSGTTAPRSWRRGGARTRGPSNCASTGTTGSRTSRTTVRRRGSPWRSGRSTTPPSPGAGRGSG